MWGRIRGTEEGQTSLPSERCCGQKQRSLLKISTWLLSSMWCHSARVPLLTWPMFIQAKWTIFHFLLFSLPALTRVTFEERRVLEAGVVFHGCWRHYDRSFILEHKSWCLALISPLHHRCLVQGVKFKFEDLQQQ